MPKKGTKKRVIKRAKKPEMLVQDFTSDHAVIHGDSVIPMAVKDNFHFVIAQRKVLEVIIEDKKPTYLEIRIAPTVEIVLSLKETRVLRDNLDLLLKKPQKDKKKGKKK